MKPLRILFFILLFFVLITIFNSCAATANVSITKESVVVNVTQTVSERVLRFLWL